LTPVTLVLQSPGASGERRFLSGGIKLSNKTHRSGRDPDALLARKSKAHPALPS
jgi:hypothetical protein